MVRWVVPTIAASLFALAATRGLRTTTAEGEPSSTSAAGAPPHAAAPKLLALLSSWRDGSSSTKDAAGSGLERYFRTYAQPASSIEGFSGSAEEGMELVMSHRNFARCLLRLPPLVPLDDESTPGAHEALATASLVEANMPRSVRHHMDAIFAAIDLNHSQSINYAEYITFLTLLAVSRHTVEVGFRVYAGVQDHAMAPPRLSGRGGATAQRAVPQLPIEHFVSFVNTIMIDPAVRVEVPSYVHGYDEAPRASGAAYSLPFEQLEALLAVTPTEEAWRTTHEGGRPWWRRWLGKGDSPRLLPPASVVRASAHASEVFSHPAEDGTRVADFYALWDRLMVLRWEVRAMEFGLVDVLETGRISVEDCTSLLSIQAHRQLGASLASASSPSATESVPRSSSMAPEAMVSWEFYRKVFSLMREPELVLSTLRLVMRSRPPTEEAVRDVVHAEDLWRALDSCHRISHGTFPSFTRDESVRILQLFRGGGGGTSTDEEGISIADLAQCCELKRSFFFTLEDGAALRTCWRRNSSCYAGASSDGPNMTQRLFQCMQQRG